MMPNSPETTLQKFFAGVTESTFQVHLGVADPPLTDYITTLLLRFLRHENLHRVRDARGRPIKEIGGLLAEADARIGEARRAVHRHIGDFTLFWAGLFPESLRKRGKVHLDQFNDYCAHGKRAYLIASEIEDGEENPTGELLERLGRQFEMCAYGLREIRREWERQEGDEPPRPFLIN